MRLPEQQLTLGVAETDLGVGNRLTLLDDQLLMNLQDVQLRNGLAPAGTLASGDFTVEMETGTGKTYVYWMSWMPSFLAMGNMMGASSSSTAGRPSSRQPSPTKMTMEIAMNAMAPPGRLGIDSVEGQATLCQAAPAASR